MNQAPAATTTAVTTCETCEMDVAPPALKKESVTTLCRDRPCLKGDETDARQGRRTKQLGWRLLVLAVGEQNERL